MSESEPPPEPADATLESRLAQTQTALDEARQTIASLERRAKIDALLAETSPVDLEVARLLTEVAVQEMEKPDVKLAIDDLRKQKPYLFRRAEGSAGAGAKPQAASAMAAKSVDDHPSRAAARRAIETGNRRDLLRYLRLRRAK